MYTPTIIEICLDVFQTIYNALNDLVSYIPMSLDELLLVFHDDLPLLTELLTIAIDLFGAGDLTLLEIIFGSVALVVLGSIAAWLIDLLQ